MKVESTKTKTETRRKAKGRKNWASLLTPFQRRVEIERRERRRLRLVIAIPALLILLTLAAGIISYEVILDMADHTESAVLKEKLEGAANTVLFANLIVSGIALVFGVGLATYIIRPIRTITQSARSITTGGLLSRVEISTPDELGDLGESFDSLIDHLNSLFRERNRYILEGFSEGLISTSADGEILAINSQAEKILGLPAEEMIGKNLSGILGTINANKIFINLLHKSLEHHSGQTLDKVSFINARGNRFNLSVTTNPIKDKDGNRMGCIITLRDLSILASFTEQIQQADRLAAVGTFATGIAHELRNPLGSIKGVAQLLAENPGEKRIKSYTSLIVSEVDRLDRVIRSILDLAQPEPEETVPADLNSLLSRALKQASQHPSIADKVSSIYLKQDTGEIPPCMVQPIRLTRAFTNIILNALQAVEPGGSVRLETKLVDEHGQKPLIEIRITNDGPPIPPENMGKIFDPFFTTRTDGTGLGLPISYQIMVFNGGTVDVTSNPGETAFILRFPPASRDEKINRDDV